MNHTHTNRKAVVVNIVSGPGAGKTTLSALLFYHLKTLKVKCEYVQEFAKNLVWKKQYEQLNDQYYVSCQQYLLFACLQNEVDVIVTDGSLLHGLYYNRYYADNTSNIDKTETMILDKFNEFDNYVCFLQRHPSIAYEKSGRYQTEAEAVAIDDKLREIMDQHNIKYTTIEANMEIEQMLELAKTIKEIIA